MQEINLRSLALGFGAGAVALLGLGLAVRSPVTVGWSLAFLGAEYAVLFVAEGGNLDRGTPLYAAGFLLVAELAFWSIERRVPAWSDPVVAELKLAGLLGAFVGAAAVAALVIVVAAAAGGGGIVLEALGVAAVMGALLLLAGLVRGSSLR